MSTVGGPSLGIGSANRPRILSLTTTEHTQFLDITDDVASAVGAARLRSGLVSIQSLHTTAAVVVNESEPLLIEDMLARLERWAPRDDVYAHDDLHRRARHLGTAERRNGHAHCRALLLPTSVVLHVVEGCLLLGRWQRVLFAEMDGPQRRELSVICVGEFD